MRTEFLCELSEIAKSDSRLVFMTADLGFGVVEHFAEQFPDRFINIGVAEQTMIASATGLAEAGFIPYCYSIATFSSLRVLEFIRNGPVAHNLPVKVVGVGAGMDYGFDGLTHFAIDDIAVLRSYPNLLIWAPADAEEVSRDALAIHNDPRPTYIRLLRRSVRCDHARLHHDPKLNTSLAILSLGDAHTLGTKVARKLLSAGVESDEVAVTQVDIDTFNQIKRLLHEVEVCVTVENHFVTGGLGSLVSEVIAVEGLKVRQFRVGVEELPIHEHGDSDFLEKRFMTDLDRMVLGISKLRRVQ